MSSFVKGFRDFIAKGNVMDMAVGVIIGAAFGKIVSSLVSDIIMPLIGLITGGVSFKDIAYELSPAVIENGQVIQPANMLNLGLFIDAIINFLIIALCIFVVIHFMQKAKDRFSKKPEEAVVEAPTVESLLTDIKVLLEKDQVIETPDMNKLT